MEDAVVAEMDAVHGLEAESCRDGSTFETDLERIPGSADPVEDIGLVDESATHVGGDVELLSDGEGLIDGIDAATTAFGTPAPGARCPPLGLPLLPPDRGLPLPRDLVLRRAGSGEFKVAIRPTDVDGLVDRLDGIAEQLSWSVILAALILGTAILLGGSERLSDEVLLLLDVVSLLAIVTVAGFLIGALRRGRRRP